MNKNIILFLKYKNEIKNMNKSKKDYLYYQNLNNYGNRNRLQKCIESCKAHNGSLEIKYKFHAGVFIKGNEVHAIGIYFNGNLY
jgi:hypothetical protein